jgi:hypothetical protein
LVLCEEVVCREVKIEGIEVRKAVDVSPVQQDHSIATRGTTERLDAFE